ncbi:MAG: PQQ-binding-like beta-propeller repeat protein [Verrucomicrobia bacterium]|nr:PQQ-binding-like beta-propeller repeat protein [Verrucomicrobiota bacterium]
MTIRFPGLLLSCTLAHLGTPLLAGTTDWPAFRGANSSGVAVDAQPPLRPGPGAGVAWQTEVPGSPSSPVVWGDRVFVTTVADGKLETRAYGLRDGRLLWSRDAGATTLEEFHGSEGSPAAGSPVTDGRHVVVYFGSCGLRAYDVDGKELWKHDLPVARTAGNFGSGTSPLLLSDRVILNRDLATGSSVMAVDLATGRTLWETPRPDSPTSYGTPILWDHDGVREVVVAGSLSMKAYDPATGAERWVVRGLPSYSCTTPVVGDGMLYYAGWSPGKADSPWPSWDSTVERQDKDGDGRISVSEFESGPVWFKAQDVDADGWLTRKDWDTIGGLMKQGENVLLAVRPGGQGDITSTHVAWKATKGLPYVPCPLHYDGRVYLVKDGGMVSAFDARNGTPAYLQERLPAQGGYYASPVAAAGRLYSASLQGKLTVFKAGGERPEVLHEADFGERIAGTPVLIGNRMLLRTQSKLMLLGEGPTP